MSLYTQQHNGYQAQIILFYSDPLLCILETRLFQPLLQIRHEKESMDMNNTTFSKLTIISSSPHLVYVSLLHSPLSALTTPLIEPPPG